MGAENAEIGRLESTLVLSFCALQKAGLCDERLRGDGRDTIATEMAFQFGRADIVLFHADGCATVIEAKLGERGYTHVVAGIGQAGLYAAQLAMTKGALREVRRALLWSSTGDVALDALIENACDAAGVIPLPWPSMQNLQRSVVAEVA